MHSPVQVARFFALLELPPETFSSTQLLGHACVLQSRTAMLAPQALPPNTGWVTVRVLVWVGLVREFLDVHEAVQVVHAE